MVVDDALGLIVSICFNYLKSFLMVGILQKISKTPTKYASSKILRVWIRDGMHDTNIKKPKQQIMQRPKAARISKWVNIFVGRVEGGQTNDQLSNFSGLMYYQKFAKQYAILFNSLKAKTKFNMKPVLVSMTNYIYWSKLIIRLVYGWFCQIAESKRPLRDKVHPLKSDFSLSFLSDPDWFSWVGQKQRHL